MVYMPYAARVLDESLRRGKIKEDAYGLLAFNALPYEAMIARLAAVARQRKITPFSARASGEKENSNLDVFVRENVKRGKWAKAATDLVTEILRQGEEARKHSSNRGGKSPLPVRRKPASRWPMDEYRLFVATNRLGGKQRFGHLSDNKKIVHVRCIRDRFVFLFRLNDAEVSDSQADPVAMASHYVVETSPRTNYEIGFLCGKTAGKFTVEDAIECLEDKVCRTGAAGI